MEVSYILAIALGGCLAFVGFNMAFRQTAVRRLLGRSARRTAEVEEDPLTYVLRISGIMIMVFGIIISGMFAAFHLAS
jgi:hypothetical protein